MKKLLFIGLIGINSTLFPESKQGQQSPEEYSALLYYSIYLMDYVHGQNKPIYLNGEFWQYCATHKAELKDVPVVEGDRINALCEDRFYTLMRYVFVDINYICFFTAAHYEKDKAMYIANYELAKRINRCRSIFPFYWQGPGTLSELTINAMTTFSDEEFDQWINDLRNFNRACKDFIKGDFEAFRKRIGNVGIYMHRHLHDATFLPCPYYRFMGRKESINILRKYRQELKNKG